MYIYVYICIYIYIYIAPYFGTRCCSFFWDFFFVCVYLNETPQNEKGNGMLSGIFLIFFCFFFPVCVYLNETPRIKKGNTCFWVHNVAAHLV